MASSARSRSGTCGALRADPSSAARLVAITGYGQEEDRARAAAAGFDLHLTKPISLEALVALLR